VTAACARKKEEVVTPPPASPAALPPGEGMLAVDGGTIWYKVSGATAGTPVVFLHGGPGFSSFYLKPLEVLGDERPVLRYDQLGGGRSDKMTDTSKMNIAHFVRELDSLRAHLGYDKMHLMGHSWGTILALEYYRVHPEHVASITFASAALDIPQWERHARELVKTLSDSAQRAIRQADADGKFDTPGYTAAIDEFYGKYVWRHPIKADLDSTMATASQEIYGYMQGPSEFTITGTLKKYDATSFLKSITVPVLFTVGEFDEADPVTIRKQAAMVPGAQVAVLKGSAHITPWDAPEENIKVLRAFLRHADSVAMKK
jgi:proline iminopeptidase